MGVLGHGHRLGHDEVRAHFLLELEGLVGRGSSRHGVIQGAQQVLLRGKDRLDLI